MVCIVDHRIQVVRQRTTIVRCSRTIVQWSWDIAIFLHLEQSRTMSCDKVRCPTTTYDHPVMTYDDYVSPCVVVGTLIRGYIYLSHHSSPFPNNGAYSVAEEVPSARWRCWHDRHSCTAEEASKCKKKKKKKKKKKETVLGPTLDSETTVIWHLSPADGRVGTGVSRRLQGLPEDGATHVSRAAWETDREAWEGQYQLENTSSYTIVWSS